MIDFAPHCHTTTYGIDPGLSGAVARIAPGRPEFPLLTVWRDFKCREDISAALVAARLPTATSVWIEQVHSMPGEGVVSVFSFGRSTGTAMGAIEAITGRKAREVAPQRWQAFFKKLFGVPRGVQFKTVTREIACKVFPEHQRFFSRKLDHGSADAALIAAYGLVVGIESAQS